MHGLFNGLEACLATLEGREPRLRDAPQQWGSKKENHNDVLGTNDSVQPTEEKTVGGTNAMQ